MLQLTPQSRIFVATEPVDFRKGIDGLAAVCRRALGDNPLSGALYVFRNRAVQHQPKSRGTALPLAAATPAGDRDALGGTHEPGVRRRGAGAGRRQKTV